MAASREHRALGHKAWLPHNGALGIAVLGSIGVAVYRAGLDDTLPATLSTTREADAAQGTLGGALEVAHGLPAVLGDTLVAGAQAAFTTGVHLGALIAAVMSLALACFVLAQARARVVDEEPKFVDQPDPGAFLDQVARRFLRVLGHSVAV